MTPWLRVLTVLAEDLGVFPSIHMVVHSHLQLQDQGM